MATPAFAQDMPEGVAPQQLLDNIWIFIAAILVFFMQAGFALVEAGLTRAKNVGNIMMKNLMDCAAGVLAFFIVGYGIAFGSDELLGGLDRKSVVLGKCGSVRLDTGGRRIIKQKNM